MSRPPHDFRDPRSACITCRPTLEVHDGPGRPVYHSGVVHNASCPTLPHLSAEAQERLRRDLAEIARARREAMRYAHTYVIGGGA